MPAPNSNHCRILRNSLQRTLSSPSSHNRMAWIGTYVYNTLFVGATDSEGYKPSVFDVVTVKDALHKKSSLPYELVDYIVDLAEYWPHTTTITTQATTVTKSITEDLRIVSPAKFCGYEGCSSLHPQYCD